MLNGWKNFIALSVLLTVATVNFGALDRAEGARRLSKAERDSRAVSCINALRMINVLSFWSTPDPNGHKPFSDAIADPNTKTMKLSMYHLTDPAVVAALEQRSAQGNFSAQIILDHGQLRDADTLQIALHLQTLPGVKVVASNPAFSITHTKYLLINDSISYITTINLTLAMAVQRDYGMSTDDAEIAAEIVKVFNNDFALGDSDLQSVAQKELSKDPEGKLVLPPASDTPPLTAANLLWSPVNSTSKLVDLINYAAPGTTLYASVENIRYQPIQQAFLQAAARGVTVKLIVPLADQNSDPSFNLPALAAMKNQIVNGKSVSVDSRVMPGPPSAQTPYMHAKMIMATGSRGTILSIMSENFSTNSLLYARELGVMFWSQIAQQVVMKDFEEDWAVSETPPPPPPPKPPSPPTPPKNSPQSDQTPFVSNR